MGEFGGGKICGYFLLHYYYFEQTAFLSTPSMHIARLPSTMYFVISSKMHRSSMSTLKTIYSANIASQIFILDMLKISKILNVGKSGFQ